MRNVHIGGRIIVNTFPVWGFAVVAAAIAAAAFVIGQWLPGFGVPFVAAASSAWKSRSRKDKLSARD
jgi:uncharacterized membrane protein